MNMLKELYNYIVDYWNDTSYPITIEYIDSHNRSVIDDNILMILEFGSSIVTNMGTKIYDTQKIEDIINIYLSVDDPQKTNDENLDYLIEVKNELLTKLKDIEIIEDETEVLNQDFTGDAGDPDDWTLTEPASCDVKIEATLNGQSDVMYLEDNNGAAAAAAQRTVSTGIANGRITFKYWSDGFDTADVIVIYTPRADANNTVEIHIKENDLYWYPYGIGLTKIADNIFTNDTWYEFDIRFKESGWYVIIDGIKYDNDGDLYTYYSDFKAGVAILKFNTSGGASVDVAVDDIIITEYDMKENIQFEILNIENKSTDLRKFQLKIPIKIIYYE